MKMLTLSGKGELVQIRNVYVDVYYTLPCITLAIMPTTFTSATPYCHHHHSYAPCDHGHHRRLPLASPPSHFNTSRLAPCWYRKMVVSNTPPQMTW